MPITCFGNNSREGAYVLFIYLSKESSLAFGKFLQGTSIPFEPGFYLYVGSALGNSSSATPLARRLVRHASRSNGKAPHKIRAQMIRFFQENNLVTQGLHPPAGKKLHWHIDYLLDSQDAQIVSVLIIRSPDRLESALSNLAASLDETFVVAQGLGARDVRSSTHLLGVRNLDSCLFALEKKIPALLRKEA